MTSPDPRPPLEHGAARAAIGSAWRFVVPGPGRDGFGRVAVYGGPEGYAAALVDAGVANAVADRPVRAAADLVLAFADATAPADEIIAAISPGGALYLELDRDRRGWATIRPRAIRALLAQAGLDRVTVYTVEPDFDAPDGLISLETPRPHAWFLRTRFSATSWAQWAGAHVRHALLAATGSPIGFRRLALVAAAAGRTQEAPLAWRACRAALDVPQDGRSLVLLHSGVERVVVLPFAPDSAEPRAVVKVPTRREHNHRTTTEHAVLGAIGAGLPSALAPAVPRPLALENVDDVAVAVESTVPGRVLSSSVRAVDVSGAQKTADFVGLMDWLIAFHRDTCRARPLWDEAAQVRWLEQPFEELTATCSPSAMERELLRHARARGRALIGLPLPTVWQHRDFNIWNLVIESGRPGVLDWEGAQAGLPLCDAFQLAVSWVQAMEFPRERSAEARALTRIVTRATEPSAAVLAAQRALHRYLDALQIDRAFVAPLLVAHRVELIHRRRQQLRRAGASAISQADIVEYPAMTSLADQTAALFAATWPEWR